MSAEFINLLGINSKQKLTFLEVPRDIPSSSINIYLWKLTFRNLKSQYRRSLIKFESKVNILNDKLYRTL